MDKLNNSGDTRFGWIVTVSRTGLTVKQGRSHKAVFSVNLLRPAAFTDSGAEDFEDTLEVENLADVIGTLRFPWQWTGVVWHAYARDSQTKTWSPIESPLTLSPGVPASPAQPDWAGPLAEEMADQTKACLYPFSQQVEHYLGKDSNGAVTQRSLVHAVAPLTHWPAKASGQALRMTGFALIDAKLVQPESVDCVVLFPEFTFEAGVQARNSGAPALSDSNASSEDDCLMSAWYEADSHLEFLCLGGNAAPASPKPVLNLSQGLVSRTTLRSLVAAHLTPLSVLARFVAESVLPAVEAYEDLGRRFTLPEDIRSQVAGGLQQILKACVDWLWRSRGLGQEYAPAALSEEETKQEGHPPNVVEWFVPDDKRSSALQLRKAINALVLGDSDREHFGSALTFLAEGRSPSATWTSANREHWHGVLRAWREVSEVASRDNPKATFSDWRRWFEQWAALAGVLLDEESACHLQGVWLSRVLRDELLGADREAFESIASDLEAERAIAADKWRRIHAGMVGIEPWSFVSYMTTAPGVRINTSGAVAYVLDAKRFPAKVPLNRGAGQVREQKSALTKLKEWQALPQQTREALEKSLFLPWTLSELADAAANALQKSLDKAGETSRPRARDRGIRLDFSEVESSLASLGAPERIDESIRGYAVALCGGWCDTQGTTWKPDLARAAWITDTAIWVPPQDPSQGSAGGTGKWWRDSNGAVVWMHDTVGSTETDGERLISVEYEGLPLASTLASEAHGLRYDDAGPSDNLKCIDFAWPYVDKDAGTSGSPRDLPLMAYGAYFGGVAIPLDNAGAPLIHAMRAERHLASLPDARSHFEPEIKVANLFRYLASEPPGAPRVHPEVPDIPASLYELTNDTQAHAYQAWSHARERTDSVLQPVALLAHRQGQDYLTDAAKESASFAITTPETHTEFFRRWVDGDRLVKSLAATTDPEDYSDPNFAAEDVDARKIYDFIVDTAGPHHLAGFSDQDLPELEARRRRAVYNPAVSAVGIEVWSPFPVDGPSRYIFEVDRTQVDQSTGKLRTSAPRRIAIAVKAKAPSSINPGPIDPGLIHVTNDQLGVTISLPPGKFVQIRAYSLVRKHHFEDGFRGRFNPEIGNAADEWSDGASNTYRAFGPLERWFEAMPYWHKVPESATALQLAERVVTSLQIRAPSDESLDADRVDVEADFLADQGRSWAPWLSGLAVQRHEWHWTGYPVRLPGGGNLAQWIASLAGVASYRESIDVRLDTTFVEDKGNPLGWHLGKWVSTDGQDGYDRAHVHTRALAAGARPARYAAYFARPVLRFAGWLRPNANGTGPRSLERLIWGAGGIVPGRPAGDRDARLPVPALKWAVPLTASYRALGGGESSGDRLARGPNGALLVFDEPIRRTDDMARIGGIGETIEVDVVDTRFPEHPEIGPNPIFHPLPPKSEKRLRLFAEPPFGLTHDIGPNPKVAQTAMIVVPTDAGGQWILARVRTRRLIEPDAELGSRVQLKNNSGVVPLRHDGEDTLPADLAVELSASSETSDEPRPLQLQIKLKSADEIVTSATIHVPVKQTSVDHRLLLTWHKGNWEGKADTITWRCQVDSQVRDPSSAGWLTVERLLSCFQSVDSAVPPRLLVDSATVTVSAPVKSVKLLRASDYSDPMWITFIGSFGRESIGMPEDYVAEVGIPPDGVAATQAGAPGPMDLLLRPRHAAAAMPLLTAPEDVVAKEDGRTASTFHVALVFRHVADLVTGGDEPRGGMLVAAFVADKEAKPPGRFRGLKVGTQPHMGLDESARLTAYVVAMQATVGFRWGDKPPSFEDLLKQAFGEWEGGDLKNESAVRFLPEFIGPIEVTFRAAP